MPKKPPAEVRANLSELRNAVLRSNSGLMESLNP
jgi:hypothetical protein